MILKSLLVSGLMACAIPAFSQIQININIGPPPPRREIRIAAPFSGAVWIPGYYVYSGHASDYDWVPGRWQAPPAPQQVWVAPRYVRSGNHYMYYEGHWHDNGKHLGQLKQRARAPQQVRPQRQVLSTPNNVAKQHGEGKAKGQENGKGNGQGNGKGHGNSGKDK